jgi:hypothetical protein
LAAGACLAAAGRSDPPIRYTMPAGTLDSPPVTSFDGTTGKLPGHLRMPLDPAKGRPVQVFADELVGGRIVIDFE